MPYRILEYEYEIMRSAVDYKKLGKKEYKLPSIMSIVLYTGRKKWNAKKYIEEVQEKIEGYEEFGFAKYDVIDVNDFSNKELIEDKSFLSKAMLIEKAKDNEEIIKYLDEITKEINSNEEIYTNEIKQIFIIMIDKILKIKIGEEKSKEFIQNIKKGKGGKEKMMTVFETIEQDNKRIFRRGMRQGEKNGRIEIAKKLLKKNFSVEEIAEITGLNKKNIKGS